MTILFDDYPKPITETVMDAVIDEARYDVFTPEQHRLRRAGITAEQRQLLRAQQNVERYETYLADPGLSDIDRCFYQGKLGVWRGHLHKLLAEVGNV